MFVRLNILVFTVFFITPSFSAELSVEDYIEHKNSVRYDHYLYGLESGLDWANDYIFQKNNTQIFCKPNDLELSSVQLRKFIDIELEQNFSFYDKYKDAPLLGLALRNAYIDNFPCT